MAIVHILGRDFDVAPYKIADLRKAAPALDRINSASGSLATIEGLVGSLGDIAEVIAVGTAKADPTMTAEFIENNAGLPDMNDLRDALKAIMAVSGMAPATGEAPAPSASAEGALTTESVGLSTS
jgi:hypothetical protein